ncbi:hypothetical protein [Xanthomonas sp. 3075]|uniref:hypothetical protein n=1 Tax=Xanthomonas sp. 3075 TaxID=3035315 RepID=UPI00160ED0DE|nr:hypothetical protein [Xanthomonas sp. 3075]MBB4133385.1 hypothetical protein [Xanthomonas sp. 3075]
MANIKNKDWFRIPEPMEYVHPTFRMLLEFHYKTERDLLQEWISEFKSPEGEKKARNAFRTQFRPVFLEIYINQLLFESGSTVDTSRNAPDFRVTKDSYTYSVEVTVANREQGSRDDDSRTEQDVYGANDQYNIIDSSISRLSGRIKNKSSDFLNNYDAETKALPFVIALGDYSSVNYGQTAYFAPLAALYCAYYDPEDRTDLKLLCQDAFDREYKYKPNHSIKKNKAVEVGFFCNDKYTHISAIIYTCMLSLGKLSSLVKDHEPSPKYVCVERDFGLRLLRFSGGTPDESIGDGVFVFHNPYASQPLGDDFMSASGVTHVRYDEDESLIEFSRPGAELLIRRYVGPKELVMDQLPAFDEFFFFTSPLPL